ncbi:MAG: hypothetical protein QNJ42_19800 [Crocosphaera sp.]|nr:hypothetical protein [Crocosphaera sp.]
MLKLKQIIPGVLASLSFAVISSVEAATVVNLDDNNNVISINDLEICISSPEICEKTQAELEENEIKIIDSYNVAFLLGSFNDVFGDPTQPDFDPSCDNGLCFWEDANQASLPITEINKAINSLSPVPSLIAGEFTPPLPPPPFPPLDNTRNFYRIPLSFDEVDGITYHQGTNNPELADPNDPGPWISDAVDFNSVLSVQPYTGFEFLGRTIITPPNTPRVPEPSSLMGIFFISGSVLMAIKKKN